MPPLIVTLLLDPVSQQRFDELRRRHFPRERNHLAAHVTLFHALPGDREEQVRRDLGCVRTPPFPVTVTGLRSLGGGVAYDLHAPELAALRARLAAAWHPWLTRQDRAPHRPHVTVQNKVPPAQARALLAALSQDADRHDVTATGLGLWRYLGGPWEPVTTVAFTA